jgi:hypothetical protein
MRSEAQASAVLADLTAAAMLRQSVKLRRHHLSFLGLCNCHRGLMAG